MEINKINLTLLALVAILGIIVFGAFNRSCSESSKLAELRGQYNALEEVNTGLDEENLRLVDQLKVVVLESETAVAEESEKAMDALAKARDVEKEKDEWKAKAGEAEKLTVEYEEALENALTLAETEIENLKRVIDIVGVPEFVGMTGFTPEFQFQEGTITYYLYMRGDAHKAQGLIYRDNYDRQVQLNKLLKERLSETEKHQKWSLFGAELGKIPWFILGAAAGYGISKLGVV